MNTLIDMTGKRFCRLQVIERAENTPRGKACWKCVCDCGNVVIVEGANLRSGASKSCGCFSRDKTILRNMKHGGAKRGEQHDRLYYVWRGMIGRCYDTKNNSFKYYGGRGITVCNKWRYDYSAFREWAVSNGYKKNSIRGKCTIDRENVNGNYEPLNCRWVDMAIQNKNRRDCTD